MARSTYRMRDFSGIRRTSWDHCAILEKRRWFGWKEIACAYADRREYENNCPDKALARCVKELTIKMEADAKNRIIAEF